MEGQGDKFLKHIANYYVNRYIGRLTMIFPNKRGAMIMREYMRHEITKSKGGIMPVIKVLPSYLTRASELEEVSNLELKFILYNCYIEVMNSIGADEKIKGFDSFAFWADVIISDFDDIDSNGVDAEALFHNLETFKEIQSTFLTPDQADVFEQIWGYRPATVDDVDSFWKHIHPSGNSPEIKSRLIDEFMNLWHILGRLYKSFHQYLEQHKIGYRGMIMREGVKNIIDRGGDTMGERIAFIGFDTIPGCARQLFDALRKNGTADFFWDVPAFDANIKGLKALVQRYPMPDDFEIVPQEKLPMIHVVGVASNYMQSKIAAAIVRQLDESGRLDTSRPDNTVIVMPDTSLLTPLLYGMDSPDLQLNVTMGLPLKDTPAGTLIHTLVSLHLRARRSMGGLALYYEDVMTLLSQPIIRAVSPVECDKLAAHIAESRLYNIDIAEIVKVSPGLAVIFDIPLPDADVHQTADYINRLIKTLSVDTNSSGDYIQVLEAYGNAVSAVLDCALKYNTPMGSSTFMMLIERLIFPAILKVNGKPVRGLQVMGILETRAIDFENVIFMSLNERIYPRRNPLRTMLPHVLRSAYCMTTIDRLEEQTAYYFYRLLTRARRVFLLYDDRPTGQAAGEKSRLITQLQYLLPPGAVKEYVCQMPAELSESRQIQVAKTPEIIDRLKEYLSQNKPQRQLSASSLKTLLACRLKFYLKHVCSLKDEDENTQFMSDATFGSVVHAVFQNLFEPYKDRLITSVTINEMLQRDIYMMALSVMDNVAYKNRYHSALNAMPGEARVLARHLGRMVKTQLGNLLNRPPFIFRGAEVPINGTMSFNVSDSVAEQYGTDTLNVNFTGSIDRLDELEDGRARIVDYKTGSDTNIFSSVNDLFSYKRKDRNEAVFQLLVYSRAVHSILGDDSPVKAELYRMRRSAVDDDTEIRIGTAQRNTPVDDDRDQAVADFNSLFDSLLSELFDSKIPFYQTEDVENCTYCKFKDMCMR